MDVVLAFDIGSSSTRCTAFEAATLKLVHSIQRKYKLKEVEEDAEVIYNLCEQLMDEMCCYLCSIPAKVSAIGICSFAMNLVGVDDENNVCTPILHYRRQVSEDTLEKVKKLFGEELSKEQVRCGVNVLHESYALGQLIEFGDNVRVTGWTTIASYILSKWIDDASFNKISLGEAAWTGMLDRTTLDWSTKSLETLQTLLFNTTDVSLYQILPRPTDPRCWRSELGVKYKLSVKPHTQQVLEEAQIMLGVPDAVAAT